MKRHPRCLIRCVAMALLSAVVLSTGASADEDTIIRFSVTQNADGTCSIGIRGPDGTSRGSVPGYVDKDGNVHAVLGKDDKGRPTHEKVFDKNGNQISESTTKYNPDGSSVTTTVSAFGTPKVTTITDKDGNVTQVVGIPGPDGSTRSSVPGYVDKGGNVHAVSKDDKGRPTKEQVFDKNGKLISESQTRYNPDGSSVTTTISGDGTQKVTVTRDKDGKVTQTRTDLGTNLAQADGTSRPGTAQLGRLKETKKELKPAAKAQKPSAEAKKPSAEAQKTAALIDAKKLDQSIAAKSGSAGKVAALPIPIPDPASKVASTPIQLPRLPDKALTPENDRIPERRAVRIQLPREGDHGTAKQQAKVRDLHPTPLPKSADHVRAKQQTAPPQPRSSYRPPPVTRGPSLARGRMGPETEESGETAASLEEKAKPPLVLAALDGDFRQVQEILSQPIDLSCKDSQGTTALIAAASTGNMEVVKILLEKAASDEKIGHQKVIDAQDNKGRTALMSATEENQAGMVRFLVDRGANVNAKDNDGVTVLMIASQLQQRDIVKLLLQSRADVNAATGHGWTPLMLAAAGDDLSMVRLLVENGADVNARTKDGATPLRVAFEEKQPTVAKFLEEKGACLEGRPERSSDETPSK